MAIQLVPRVCHLQRSGTRVLSSSATSFLILVERPSLLTRRLLDNLSIILSNRRKLRRFDGEFLSEGTSQVHLSVNVGPTRNVSLKMFSALDSSISTFFSFRMQKIAAAKPHFVIGGTFNSPRYFKTYETIR
jgi:hypothetical protein